MKVNKLIYTTALASLVGCASLSCSDSFLDEDLITAQSTDYFKTQNGIDELVIGTYQKLKFKFNYIWAIECHNMGVDEFTDANNSMPAWNHYSSALNSTENGANQPMWDNYYGMIEPANIIIKNVPLYYDQASSFYNTRLGEGYFMRAYGYFELVKQFGGVPLKLEPSTSVETYFVRNSEEDCFAQIIADFEKAYDLLPNSNSIEATGRVSKQAAAHFLAKAHLFRASELYGKWNTAYVAADLDAVIKYGKEVVAAHPLCNDFVELWDYQQVNGANEKVSEVVLAAQFSDDQTTWGRYGNQLHLYYPSVYQDIQGTKRDISGDREFSYVSATEYTMQVFDRVNDSRFWKSFITCYGCNNTAGAPKWTQIDADYAKLPSGAVVGNSRFVGGETAIKYIVNNPGDTRFARFEADVVDDGGNIVHTDFSAGATDIKVLKDGVVCNQHTFVRYFNGESFNWNTNIGSTTGNYYSILPHKRSVALSKYRDGYRIAIASQFGTRDAIIARSADDVLMIAEAYIRKGAASYSDAITWINKLRERAGYSDGEDRGVNVDGGQAYKNNTYCAGKGGGFKADGAIYSEENTYYESNDLETEKPTASTKTNMVINSVEDIYNSSADSPIYSALECSSDADKLLCFILDERTRELCGELHRWEDLARTKTLNARWHAFNDGKSRGIGEFDPAKHYYRPIPQSFLDGITNGSGASLSDDEKSEMQNPGY